MISLLCNSFELLPEKDADNVFVRLFFFLWYSFYIFSFSQCMNFASFLPVLLGTSCFLQVHGETINFASSG